MRSSEFADFDDEFWSPISRPHFFAVRSFAAESVSDGARELPTEDLPFSLYLPERYEPRYAYPVVIWLHGNGRNEHQLQQVMPAISDQNYIGIAFRGTSDDDGRSKCGAFEWDLADEKVIDFADEIDETLHELQRFLRIDSERIYLAGHQGGAAMALRMLLHAPERFCGAVALGGWSLPDKADYARFRILSSRRVLLGMNRRDEQLTSQQFAAAGRALEQCGVHVTSRVYDAGETIAPTMLRDIDHWVMSARETAFAG